MNLSGLLDWQKEPAQHLVDVLRKNGAAVDGSETGVGKTYTAGAVIRELNLPTLVICPKVGIPGWRKMGQQLGVEFDCINWEKVRTGRTPYCTYDGKDFHWDPAVHFLIFDEIHRACGLNSLNSQLVIAAKTQRIFTLGLSATLGQTPMDFKAIGFLLGLHALQDRKTSAVTVQPGFFRWARRHGCTAGVWGGHYFAGSDAQKRAIMANINEKIFPDRGARVRVADLGDAFPERQIIAELYDMGNQSKIDELWETMGEALADLKARQTFDKDPNHPMTRLIRARQELELLKVPTFLELGKDVLVQGYSVAFFVCFSQTLEELASRLNIKSRIDGTQAGEKGMRDREECVKAFQSNRERIIACNVDAGGVAVSLHDEHGGHPRIGFVSLGYSATKIKQVLGRLHRAGSKSKALYRIPLAAGTMDERVHRAITPKLNRLDALMDGDLEACNLPVG